VSIAAANAQEQKIKGGAPLSESEEEGKTRGRSRSQPDLKKQITHAINPLHGSPVNKKLVSLQGEQPFIISYVWVAVCT